MATQELTNTTTLGTDVTYPHTNFRTVTEEELQEIITEINNQPRKHLHQATPAETHQHHTQPHQHSDAPQARTGVYHRRVGKYAKPQRCRNHRWGAPREHFRDL